MFKYNNLNIIKGGGTDSEISIGEIDHPNDTI